MDVVNFLSPSGAWMLPDDSLHLDILRNNIADAKGPLPCVNWAQGIEMKFAALCMASPCISRVRYGTAKLRSPTKLAPVLSRSNGLMKNDVANH